MKALNNLKFVTKAALAIENYKLSIRESSDIETAKKRASAALGYIDCMVDYLNTMTCCTENNDFVQELDCLTEEWTAGVYGAAGTWGAMHGADHEWIMKCFKERDMHIEASK